MVVTQAQVLQPENSLYPSRLKEISDYPQKLWVTGDSSVLSSSYLMAIVGAREASAYGREVAKKLAKELASLGFVIVSGMAEGIDTAAHEGALEAGGKTIAVFGTSIETTFPAANKQLRLQIESNGCCLSELEPGTRGAPWTFPKRNRIISGLSMGVVVVEAGFKSGSLITARMAAEQGREVFAVPGLITSSVSQGTHHLIQGGAKLVTCVNDIVSEFPKLMLPQLVLKDLKTSSVKKAIQQELPLLPPDQKKIMELLLKEASQPKHIDELCHESGFSMNEISEILLELEMNNQIQTLPGSRFQAKQGVH